MPITAAMSAYQKSTEVATADVAQYIGATAVISASDEDYLVQLLEVRPGAPVDFTPPGAADVLCLDLESFGVESAVAWVQHVQTHSVNERGLPLCVVVVGREDILSIEDLWRVSEELEPAGAIFHDWPEHCRSFRDVFKSLAESLLKFDDPSLALRR